MNKIDWYWVLDGVRTILIYGVSIIAISGILTAIMALVLWGF